MHPECLDQPTIRLGIDIGGTFTDFVIFDPSTGSVSTFKLPSTPHDPSEAVLDGIRKLRLQMSDNHCDETINSENPLPQSNPHSSCISIIHGSTVATNALLERKGAVTALITTSGFKDVIQIGRQNRPSLYDFTIIPPEPLIPAELRFELEERVDQYGDVITDLQNDDIEGLIANLQLTIPSVQSIAVVFLFSFANPKHEQIVAEKLRAKGYFVSASHEILPEYREYERTSTTAVNAYVSPVLDRYLARLETDLNQMDTKGSRTTITNLQIMQSNGGSISVSEARRSGVRCILSGPAGGVVGCQYIGEIYQSANPDHPSSIINPQLLTFDMGGTSTDVSLVDGLPQITSEAEVGGLPIRIPVLDIHTIGAGGGSIASIDAGSAMRVGPESAGAFPGPACYGRGDVSRESQVASDVLPTENAILATVTDANLLLGRIPADHFLGGKMTLYPELAEYAISPIAEKLGLSLNETALGIIEITNAHMERALRVISVERGHDPRQYTLLSFGGAGGLHSSDLARRLNIPQVLIPPYAATLSAFGMLAADVVKDYTLTVMLPGNTPVEDIASRISRMQESARHDIQSEGFTEENTRLESALDMRYQGQSYELTVPFTENFVEDFHESHHRTYGYRHSEANLEIVNLRVRVTGLVDSPQIVTHPRGPADPSTALIGHHPVVMGKDQIAEIPFYKGETLKPGNLISGPAVVVRDDTTILISEYDTASIDPYLNLIIEIGS